MISNRLLSKLEIGKKYIVTDGIKFYIFQPAEGIIWCTEWGWNTGTISLYQKTWSEVLGELDYYSDDYNSVYYDYNRKNPTYRYYAHVSQLFASGRVYFSLYNLYFLGEYKEGMDVKDFKKYCDLHGISYSWQNRKERLKSIYK